MEAFLGWSTPDRLPAFVGDYEKLNFDRLFADSRGVGHDRYESGQHQASKQLVLETAGTHQGLGNAAWNVAKALQGELLVGRHVSSLPQSGYRRNIAG
jgi:hypothetical protein